MCNGRRETVAMRSPPLTNKQKREKKKNATTEQTKTNENIPSKNK